MKNWMTLAMLATLSSAPAFGAGTVLLEEKFDNNSFSSRGWYDNTNQVISTTHRAPGSSGSVQYTFRAGATQPTTGGGMRHKFTETDTVYLRYYVKYSSNWVGSQQSYHPHEFYLLTNLDGDWSGLASTSMTAYIEQNGGRLQFVTQDSKNIDSSKINVDLTNVTEYRATAGCNGNSDGYSSTCYQSGSGYRNGKTWKASTVSFSNTTGPNYKGDWHLVEAYVKLNSVVNGKGVADGIVKYWVDGAEVLNKSNLLLRTGAHPNMRFNQLVIGPYIGNGSPVEQSFWIDELILATDRLGTPVAPPAPPQNFRAVQ